MLTRLVRWSVCSKVCIHVSKAATSPTGHMHASERTMSNLLCAAAEATKVATVAPSSDSTVFTMQLNCWKPPGASVPGTPGVTVAKKH